MSEPWCAVRNCCLRSRADPRGSTHPRTTGQSDCRFALSACMTGVVLPGGEYWPPPPHRRSERSKCSKLKNDTGVAVRACRSRGGHAAEERLRPPGAGHPLPLLAVPPQDAGTADGPGVTGRGGGHAVEAAPAARHALPRLPAQDQGLAGAGAADRPRAAGGDGGHAEEDVCYPRCSGSARASTSCRSSAGVAGRSRREHVGGSAPTGCGNARQLSLSDIHDFERRCPDRLSDPNARLPA